MFEHPKLKTHSVIIELASPDIVGEGCFIGCDIAFRRAGLAAVYRDRVCLYKIDMAKLPAEQRFFALQSLMRAWLRKQVSPQLAAIENGSFGSIGRLFQLGGSYAVATTVLMECGVGYLQPPPASIKKAFARNTSAKKGDMYAAALKVFPDVPNDDDLVDAFALADLAKQYIVRDPPTRKMAEVLASLPAPTLCLGGC